MNIKDKYKRNMGLPFRAVWVDEDFNELLSTDRLQGENTLSEYKSLFECSVCGASCDDTYTWDCEIRYCPNCGVRIKGADNEN